LLLGTLTAGLVGAAILLWRFIDIDKRLEAAEGDTPPAVEEVVAELSLPELPAAVPWTAYIYESRRSAGFFPDAEYYPRLIARWEQLLGDLGAGVRHLSSWNDLDSLAADDLLVIPAGVCLGDEERGAISRYAERGGNLLITWALGARDASCAWLGYDYLRELADAGSAGTLEGQPPTYVTVRGSPSVRHRHLFSGPIGRSIRSPRRAVARRALRSRGPPSPAGASPGSATVSTSPPALATGVWSIAWRRTRRSGPPVMS
jgi:hypothetical protein